MGRKTESLQHALIKRVLPKILNNKTGATYKKHLKNFAKWAKEQGYRHPEQITKDVIQEYEQHLETSAKQYSPATIHTYLAPVCAAVRVPMDQIRKPKRTSGTITRGRDRDANGNPITQNQNGRRQEKDPRYTRLVALQSAVGIRRAELGRLTGADLVHNGADWFINVRKGKGGKRQLQYILPKDVPVVRHVFAGIDPDQEVFSRKEMNNLINLHGMRAEHGKECYEYYLTLFNSNPEAADKMRQVLLRRWDEAHHRLRDDNPEAWLRQRNRFKKDMDNRPYVLRGDNAAKAIALELPTEYSRLALMCISVLHLSHWRLDVTVTNYLLR